jgi:hypothetical protein
MVCDSFLLCLLYIKIGHDSLVSFRIYIRYTCNMGRAYVGPLTSGRYSGSSNSSSLCKKVKKNVCLRY